MSPPVSVKAGNSLIRYELVREVRIPNIEVEEAIIVTHDGEQHVANGFDAIEAVMLFKPSALEGRRLRWKAGAWALHNIFGHPAMQVLAWLGLKRWAIRLHDATTPRPRSVSNGDDE